MKYIKNKLFEYGCYSNAVKNFRTAYFYFSLLVLFDRNYPEIFINRGKSLFYLKKYNDAISDFNKAIESDYFSYSFYYRGHVKEELENFKDALADYTHALQMDPHNIIFLMKRGQLFVKMKRHHDALSDFDRLTENNPLNTEPYLQRGLVYISIGNKNSATIEFFKALEIKKSDRVKSFIKEYLNYEIP